MKEHTTSTPPGMEYRYVISRLHPGRIGKSRILARLCGANHWVWNEILSRYMALYRAAKKSGEKPPSCSFFSLGKQFTILRRETQWLQELSSPIVRHTLKHQADAWTKFFKSLKSDKKVGPPKFKKWGNTESFTIPFGVKIKNGKLFIPGTRKHPIGWMKLHGSKPPPDGVPKKAVVKRIAGKWYAYICYEVPYVEREDSGLVIGLDRNVGQVATSNGMIHYGPDIEKQERRKRRYQRKMARQREAAKLRRKNGTQQPGVHPKHVSNRYMGTKLKFAKVSRKIATKRRNWQHQVSNLLRMHTIVVEKLNVRRMTSSAKGTVEKPGKNVRQKTGLNRGILNTGWTDLKMKLNYKCPAVIEVNPAYTSQTCYECRTINKRSRVSQSKFLCVACGHADNADVNASLNIRRLGIAHLDREDEPLGFLRTVKLTGRTM